MAQDWNGGQQQQYGSQGQQAYGLHQQHSLEQHQQQLPPGTPGLYEQTVSSPNGHTSASTLPPMSSFGNRPPSSAYGPSSASSSAPSTVVPISMSASPGLVDIKPELTSLYPPVSHQQEAQWSMHRSAPAYPGSEPKLPGEVPHLHNMVSLSSLNLLVDHLF